MEYKFPDGFLWGSATSAHQVEGGNFNDWSEWEQANAERLTQAASRKGWPDYILERYPNPLQPENYISGLACDHYNRYEEDFDIAKSLGQNAHRFSIEWSRVEPEEGKFNEAEIEHYRKVILALKSRGIEPFVTLWHWTNPVWIRDIGGWENKKTIEYFLRYAKKIVENYGDLIKFWIPINEPGVYIGLSYITGTQPPGVKSVWRGNKVFKNLIKTHKEAYKIIHSCQKNAQVGISHFSALWQPLKKTFVNILLEKILNYITDKRFINPAKKSMDFIGIQYYRPELINFKIGGNRIGLFDIENLADWQNDLGWGIYPEGVYHSLKEVAKLKKPIYITESGTADARDTHRKEFIVEHLKWIAKAIDERVDVHGYFYWSLLDNFEFVEIRGFWPRFGLVEIDYKTLERKIRPSAFEYAKICRENKISYP